MRLPRVLIFTVTYEGKDYCRERFTEHLESINYPKDYYRHIWIDNSVSEDYFHLLQDKYGTENVFHTLRGANSREALTRCQEMARKLAIKDDYDYLMSLESDILVPPNIIQRLLGHAKKVVSILYFIGDRSKGERIPCLTLPEFSEELGAWGSRLLKPEEFIEYLNVGLVSVHAAGMGGCLISKEVFKDIVFYYDPRFKGHSDIYFFQDCFIKRIPVYVDTDTVCEHLNSSWELVKDR